MFRIRRVYDTVTPANSRAVLQVQDILRSQFSLVSEKEVAKLPEKLSNPFKYRFRSILFVADDIRVNVKGFALLMHEPNLMFCFLDYISAGIGQTGHGVGSALYQRVREEAQHLKALGIFFECLPDDPLLSHNPVIRKQNEDRLRFYERFGARPIINTAYETPCKPGEDNPPYLVYDNLGQNVELSKENAREIVHAILERKYSYLCPYDYIEMVIQSIQDDPVQLRQFKYTKSQHIIFPRPAIPPDKRILLVVNDKHAIHHVRERGYVESPVRIDSILRELRKMKLFQIIAPKSFSEKYIAAVHDTDFINYLKKACNSIDVNTTIYPYVFPIRNVARPPKELPVRAGYYCIDTFTPITRNSFQAAKRAVDCVLTVAQKILDGHRLAYALVRPPGHHAERRSFGGFCYFNSAAIAAQYLSKYGKVAMLDIDYHHGNGQQNIFYKRSDVLTVSIHAHPRFAYPYFSGFKDEKGEGEGKGYNRNFPLQELIGNEYYCSVLGKALRSIKKFKPCFLVVCLGLDTAKGDPTGTWSLRAGDFETIGKMIGSLNLCTLVVEEGGYGNRVLGTNARHFFSGLWTGANTL